MTNACVPVVVNGQNCISCPAQPAVAGVPAQTITDNRYGWNAGANSAVLRAGDVYTQFTIPANAIGVVCGLAPARLGNDPRDVAHAFYIYQAAGKQLWVVLESGVPVGTPVVRAPDTDLFRIERRAGVVRYLLNGRQQRISAIPSTTPLRVIACLYAAADGIN